MSIQLQMLGYRSCASRVRFGQTDRYGYTWHGHLPCFFEEARSEFARAYDLGTDFLLAHDTSIPIVLLHATYLAASYEGDVLDVEYTLLRPAPRVPTLLFVYRLFRSGEARKEVARGYTRQQLISVQKGPRVRVPSPITERLEGAFRGLAEQPRWPDATGLVEGLTYEVVPTHPLTFTAGGAPRHA